VAKGQEDLRKKYQEAGFEIVEAAGEAGSFAVKKGDCTQPLERDGRGAWQPAGPPTLKVRGLDCRLEDRGYQKFWLHGDQRIPIRVSDLKTLHHFDQEVRLVLGRKSLYHESLGSTSARSAYDRLDGRPDR
jgi:hypothetical protein